MEKGQLLRQIGKCRQWLTKQQLRTLKGQVLAGDVSGAEKGLCKLIKRRWEAN